MAKKYKVINGTRCVGVRVRRSDGVMTTVYRTAKKKARKAAKRTGKAAKKRARKTIKRTSKAIRRRLR
jgi:hypothetical protein